MTTRPFCSPECRENGGWIVDPDELQPARRCHCRLDPRLVAIAEREAALAGTAGAHGSVLDAAMLIIEDAANAFQELSANDLRGLMQAAQIPGPVIGAAFSKARYAGLIAPIGRESSTQRATHGHGISRYRSLVYKTKEHA